MLNIYNIKTKKSTQEKLGYRTFFHRGNRCGQQSVEEDFESGSKHVPASVRERTMSTAMYNILMNKRGSGKRIIKKNEENIDVHGNIFVGGLLAKRFFRCRRKAVVAGSVGVVFCPPTFGIKLAYRFVIEFCCKGRLNKSRCRRERRRSCFIPCRERFVQRSFAICTSTMLKVGAAHSFCSRSTTPVFRGAFDLVYSVYHIFSANPRYVRSPIQHWLLKTGGMGASGFQSGVPTITHTHE